MKEVVKIDYNNEPLKGLIYYLTKNSELDIDQIIKAESSSIYTISFQPKNVLKYDKKCFFCSAEEENASITLDFQEYRIAPFAYTIKARQWVSNFITDWRLQGSNDKEKWFVLDDVINETSLKTVGSIKTFTITQNNTSGENYRYIQIVLTDVGSDARYYLSFDSIEFFGILYKC